MSGVNNKELYDLPQGWKWVKLKDLCCKILGGGTPSTKEPKFWDGDIPWISSADIEGIKEVYPRRKITREAVEKSTTNILPKGGIIVVTRVGLGKIAIAPFDICFSQDSQGLVLNEKRIAQSYALIYLSKAVQKFKHESRGTTINGVTKKQLVELDIPLPPLSEQDRIASKLEELFSELDNSIEDLKTAQQQLKVYRQSVLKWAFEEKLKNMEVSEKEFRERSKHTKLGDILDVLTDYHANGSYLKLKENVTLKDDRDYAIMIRATNFEKNDFASNLKYITKDAYNYLSKSKLFGGEILIGKIGNAGKVYYMPNLNRPASLAMNLFALRCKKEVNTKYLYYHLISPSSNKEIKASVKGVGNPTIDKNAIRSLNIILPDLDAQNRIVNEIESRLSLADKVEETIVNSLAQAEVLRQSILKKAFAGQLL